VVHSFTHGVMMEIREQDGDRFEITYQWGRGPVMGRNKKGEIVYSLVNLNT
jgi:hypothetical protein